MVHFWVIGSRSKPEFVQSQIGVGNVLVQVGGAKDQFKKVE